MFINPVSNTIILNIVYTKDIQETVKYSHPIQISLVDIE